MGTNSVAQSVYVSGFDSNAIQQVHDAFAGYFYSAFWCGVGLICGAICAGVFFWMIGKAHE